MVQMENFTISCSWKKILLKNSKYFQLKSTILGGVLQRDRHEVIMENHKVAAEQMLSTWCRVIRYNDSYICILKAVSGIWKAAVAIICLKRA